MFREFFPGQILCPENYVTQFTFSPLQTNTHTRVQECSQILKLHMQMAYLRYVLDFTIKND